tara:strand:+ start:984 stop:1235 length:252 start_codon:yes stop_codon:yes gene_type:complete
MQQGLRAFAVFRIYGDAYTRGDKKAMFAEFDWLIECLADFHCYIFRVDWLYDVGQQQDELVATEAGNSVGFPNTPLQASGNFD